MVSVQFHSWSFTDITTSQYPTASGWLQLALASLSGHNMVTISSLEYDSLGEELQVIWELEPGARVIEKVALPEPTGSSDDVRSHCLAYEEWELFLTSAKLTERASTPNIELGLLITGGELSQQAEQHFLGRIQDGVLVSVQ